jgi:uncharacterized protein HemY
VPAIRDAARAVELAKKAVKLEPNREGYWDTLGVALYRSGDWDGAAEALRRSRELMGRDDPGTVLVLAMAQWRRGRPDEARALFDEAATPLRRPGATVTDEQSQFLGEASALLGESPAPRQGPGARSSTEPKAPPG